MKKVSLVAAALALLGASEAMATDFSLDFGRGRHRDFVCAAKNWRGQTFRARGSFPQFVQRRAMDECLRYSRNCRPVGCREINDRWDDGRGGNDDGWGGGRGGNDDGWGGGRGDGHNGGGHGGGHNGGHGGGHNGGRR